MPYYMPHKCGLASRFHEARRNNAASRTFSPMLERQKPIAQWMMAVMERRKISARAWAETAKLGKDTVSRAIRDNYAHVTSTSTIVKLAEAIGEQLPGAAGSIPSATALAGVLRELHRALAPTPPSDDVIEDLALALRDTLLQLVYEPEAAGDLEAVSMLARVSARQRDGQSAQSRTP
jgi:hypothetical protein